MMPSDKQIKSIAEAHAEVGWLPDGKRIWWKFHSENQLIRFARDLLAPPALASTATAAPDETPNDETGCLACVTCGAPNDWSVTQGTRK